jgi:hypothetical protein
MLDCTHPVTVEGRHVATGLEVRVCSACGIVELLEAMPIGATCTCNGRGWCWYDLQRAASKPGAKKKRG